MSQQKSHESPDRNAKTNRKSSEKNIKGSFGDIMKAAMKDANKKGKKKK